MPDHLGGGLPKPLVFRLLFKPTLISVLLLNYVFFSGAIVTNTRGLFAAHSFHRTSAIPYGGCNTVHPIGGERLHAVGRSEFPQVDTIDLGNRKVGLRRSMMGQELHVA
jgi:hypothetical protein